MLHNSPLHYLPNDLWFPVLNYLIPKDVCGLDSALLNHSLRSIFLQVLPTYFRENPPCLLVPSYSHELVLQWYDARNIALSSLHIQFQVRGKLSYFTDVPRFFLKYHLSLKHININLSFYCRGELVPQGFMGLSQCTQLESLQIHFYIFFPPSPLVVPNIFKSLINLQTLSLSGVCIEETSLEALCKSGSPMKALAFKDYWFLDDRNLSGLLLSFPSLTSLSLNNVEITDQSVKMLMNMCPRIKSIEIRICTMVSRGCLASFVRDISIPHILNESDTEVSICSSISTLLGLMQNYSWTEEEIHHLLSSDLLNQFLTHISRTNSLAIRDSMTTVFLEVCQKGNISTFVESEAIPALLQAQLRFPSTFSEDFYRLLDCLLSKGNYQEYLLQCGVLSSFHFEVQHQYF